jgi:hypothetical protein
MKIFIFKLEFLKKKCVELYQTRQVVYASGTSQSVQMDMLFTQSQSASLALPV